MAKQVYWLTDMEWRRSSRICREGARARTGSTIGG